MQHLNRNAQESKNHTGGVIPLLFGAWRAACTLLSTSANGYVCPRAARAGCAASAEQRSRTEVDTHGLDWTSTAQTHADSHDEAGVQGPGRQDKLGTLKIDFTKAASVAPSLIHLRVLDGLSRFLCLLCLALFACRHVEDPTSHCTQTQIIV